VAAKPLILLLSFSVGRLAMRLASAPAAILHMAPSLRFGVGRPAEAEAPAQYSKAAVTVEALDASAPYILSTSHVFFATSSISTLRASSTSTAKAFGLLSAFPMTLEAAKIAMLKDPKPPRLASSFSVVRCSGNMSIARAAAHISLSTIVTPFLIEPCRFRDLTSNFHDSVPRSMFPGRFSESRSMPVNWIDCPKLFDDFSVYVI